MKLYATSFRLQASGEKCKFNEGLCLMACSLWFVFLTSCAKPLYKDMFIIAGTYLEVNSPYKEAAGIVYNEFKRLDKIFNFYDPQSELSRLNNTYNSPLKVSRELMEVLQLSKQVNEMTEGAFDVSYGSLYNFWKELIKKGKVLQLPSKEKIMELQKMGGMDNVEMNPTEGTVVIKKEGLKIDLGAIAVGYMVDKAVLKLKEKGIDSALINAGGDIYCLGTNKAKPWIVGIKDPKEMQGIIESEALVDEAITTSGNYEQFFEFGGKRYSHLIDPRKGYPVDNDILSVSVITKNCTTADSFSTAFFIMGLEGIQNFISQNPSTMRIFVLTQDKSGKQLHKFGPPLERSGIEQEK